MRYAEFEKLAIISLVGSQEENGSWLNDDATTCAVLEVLLEHALGPHSCWNHSWIASDLRGDGINSWPLRDFRFGSQEYRNATPQILSSVLNGFHFGQIRHDSENLWLSVKWHSLFTFMDFDSRPDDSRLESALLDMKYLEPWLLAQLCKYFLFADRAYGNLDYQLERCGSLTSRIQQLVSSVSLDHWVSRSVSPEETTAIVAQFLFHPGLSILLSEARYRSAVTFSGGLGTILRSLQTGVLKWIRQRQGENGSWGDSPSITAHCIHALSTALEDPSTSKDFSDENRAAVQLAVRWLTSNKTVPLWDDLRSYQYFVVLLALRRLSSADPLREIFENLHVSSQNVKRDVFISYGGCDRDFAHRLASDLEASGIRVWFAEWDIDYGDDVVEEIQKGLDETSKFLIVLSPDALERSWVRQELSTAFHKALNGAETSVIPLMLKDCRPPAFLRTKRWADFTRADSYDTSVTDLARHLKHQRIKRS